MGPVRRYRVERKELLPFFGQDTPQGNVPHCVSDESGTPVLYRIYLAQGSVSHTLQRAREHVAIARATAAIKPYLESGLYGVAILVPSRERLKPMMEAIRRHELTTLAPIICGVGPTAATLASELRRPQS